MAVFMAALPAVARAGYALGTPTQVPGATNVDAIACPTSTQCDALTAGTSDTSGVVTIVNGSPSAVRALSGVDPAAIACSSASTCYVTGVSNTVVGSVVVPIVNGVPGSPETLPASSDQDLDPYSISCVGTQCWIVGADEANSGGFITPVTNGTPGTAVADPSVAELSDISCVTATSCVGVGIGQDPNGEGAIQPISAGTPGAAALTASAYSFNNIVCTSASTCVVAGTAFGNTGIVGPVTNGAVGTLSPTPGVSLEALSCPSSTTCLGVINDSLLPITNGVPGTAVNQTNTAFGGISCTTASSCIATGAASFTGGVQEAAVIPVTTGSSTTTAKLTLTGASQKAGVAKAGLACTLSACRGTVTETASVTKQVGHVRKKVTETVASANYSLAAGGHGTVSLKLNSAGRQALSAAHKKLKVSLVIRLTSGKTSRVVSTRFLTLT